MFALPILLGWLALAAEPAATAPAGELPPPARLAELHDLGRLALLREDGAVMQGFSARDPLGVRDGVTVLARADGPGVVQRIWIADPAGSGMDNRRLRITIDRSDRPIVDRTLAELASGADPRFPSPIVGARMGGFVSYVPVAFRDGCAITLQGAGTQAYEVSVLKLPTSDGVSSFPVVPTNDDVHALKLAQALWLEPEALFSNEPSYSRERLWRELSIRKQAEDVEYPVDGTERSHRLFALPPGPRTIRSFDLVIDPKTLDNWRSARLRVIWEDGDDASPAVDVAMHEFFALTARGTPYRSLLSGENENVWSNRLPMPYRRAASVMIDAEGPIRGMFRVRTVRGAAPNAGYLRVSSKSAAGPALVWGPESGRGQVVGTFLTLTGSGPRTESLAETLSLLADDRPLLARGTPLVHEFNAAWPDVKDRLDMAQTFPLAGFPRFQSEGGRWFAAAYRWRLTDPVSFQRSIALRIEPDAARATQPDGIRATVFWYSDRSGPAPAGRPPADRP